jgi:hypothetical protein
MLAFRIAKAKVAGSNPVFRSKLPGFRAPRGSGLFHGRRLPRRRLLFTTVRGNLGCDDSVARRQTACRFSLRGRQ